MSLAGRRILLTRPEEQSARLLSLLVAEGADARLFPVMRIAPEPAAQARLAEAAVCADWLVLVSPTAIDQAWPHLQGRLPVSARLACVGASSARKLAALSGRDVLHPQDGNDSEALLALPELAAIAGQRFLIVRGSGGRPLLAETLASRGARVDFAEIYRREDGEPDWSLLQPPLPDAIVVTSSEMAAQLFRLAGSARTTTLQCLLYCVPHPRIAEQLAGLGASRIMTTRADDAALVAGLREWFSRHP